MKPILFLLPTVLFVYAATSQDVGIGTTSPQERLHVVDTSNANKHSVYGYAKQSADYVGDFQNTGIAGFGQGNGVGGGAAGSYGYGIGVKGIGSTGSYGAVGVYAAIASSIPNVSFGHGYYALLADAGTPANNRHAAIFLNGNVGIGTYAPTSRLHAIQTGDINKTVIYADASQSIANINDYQNTAITGFAQGNGTVGGFGYAVGVKGIASNKALASVGVYAGISQTVPNISMGNFYYAALYADAGTPAANAYAGVFLNGNVGIGVAIPKAKLHVSEDDVVFSAVGVIPISQGDPPITGGGRRMMWYSDKAAFRTGYVSGAQWDKANVGNYSIASGRDAIASGEFSAAMGYQVTASGDQSSIAMGYQVTASGNQSVAMGFQATASGDRSIALGSYVSTAGITGSMVIGDNSTTSIMSSVSTNTFRARFANGYRLYTTADYSVNCYLGGGSNAWSTTSDVRKKENFEVTDGEEALQKIAGFSLGSWNYKGQDPKTFRHYGPTAQDFYAAFGKDQYGTIGNDTTINQADFDGINLIAIAALEKRTKKIEELQKENSELKKEVALIKQQMEEQTRAMVKRLEQLETLVASKPNRDTRLAKK